MARSVVTEAHLRALGLPEAGIEYVLEVQESPPARKVGRRRVRNLVLEVPLRNLPGVLLQAESLTGEYMFLLQLERRRDINAAFDQPVTIDVNIVDKLGRSRHSTYTADYLVIDEKEATAVEVKSDKELKKLCRKRSIDWVFDGEHYRYLPAEAAFGQRGIRHIVVPVSNFNQLLEDNHRLLINSRYATDTLAYRRQRRGVVELLSHESAMRMSEILERTGMVDATPILQLIDQGGLFAALDLVTLTDYRGVWISKSEQLARTCQESTKSIAADVLLSEGELVGLLNPSYEGDTLLRLAVVQGVSRLRKDGEELSERTVRRLKKAYRESGGDIKSLEPGWARCGRDGPYVGNLHLTYILDTIRQGRSETSDPSVAGCFRAYKQNFDQAKAEYEFFDACPIGRSTYYNYWNRAPLSEAEALNKGGRRLANECSKAFEPNQKTLLVSRPFSVAHIDHWKVDLHIVVGTIKGKKLTKRPWLTAMVDSHTGEVLAIWLSFADPSKRACSMVIRDCVRRHGRLPEMLIVDGGSDFKSVHFSTMLATLGVTKCERPPEDPRFGKEVERVFGVFKQKFARGMPGYGISIERARSVSAAFKASNTARLTLVDAFEVLEAFIFRGYNACCPAGRTLSRIELREAAMSTFPHGGRACAWDLRFLIATSVEAPAEDYRLTPGRGLHVNGFWYTSGYLSRYVGYKKDLVVRVEPYADSIIYVWVEDRWCICMRSDVRLQAAITEATLVFGAAQHQDLSAIRREIESENNKCVANLINEKLSEISGRDETRPSQEVETKVASSEENADMNFDDIVPYLNEVPSE